MKVRVPVAEVNVVEAESRRARADGATHGSGVQSVERAMAITSILAATSPASLSELAERTALPVTTTHRLLATLTARDWVRRLPSGDYVPGPALVRLGAAARRSIDPLVEPALRMLADATGETANYAVLDGDAALYLAQQQSSRMMRMFTEVGARVPAHATAVGKVLLAGLDDDTVRSLLEAADRTPSTPRSVSYPGQLSALVRRARTDGYAVDDEERELGVRCVAVPVLDRDGHTVGAVSVSGPASRVELPPPEPVLEVLREAAAMIGGDH
jgi:IclR family transcriptional regulator, acetate operon repressor